MGTRLKTAMLFVSSSSCTSHDAAYYEIDLETWAGNASGRYSTDAPKERSSSLLP